VCIARRRRRRRARRTRRRRRTRSSAGVGAEVGAKWSTTTIVALLPEE